MIEASISLDGRFLVFPNRVFCFRLKEKLFSILLNDDRKNVYNLILQYLNNDRNKVLVTGSPGIGRSILVL